MERIFSADFQLLWAVVLALALFLPVRNLIHVMMVRRARRQTEDVDEAESARLKRRAGFTAGLLCFVFAFFYTAHLFKP